MTAVAATVKPIPWWREPTKEQWYAYMAAWAGWTLDGFDFTAFLLIMAPIAKEFGVPVAEVGGGRAMTLLVRLWGAVVRGGGGADDHALVAAGRRHCERLARRPDRPQDAADGLDRVVLDLQLLGRLVAELFLIVPIPRPARHRHGSGMAGRGRPRDGELAGPLTRLHGCGDAGLMGDWVSAVEPDLRLVLRRDRLAWPADDRHIAGPSDHLDSSLRQGARGLG